MLPTTFSKKERGELLEDSISHIFRHWGFDVRTRVKLKDKYEVSHEIDVLASKTEPFGTVRIAVECKYVQKPVGIKVLRNFHEKLSILDITKGILVSTASLSRDAMAYAKSVGIESWDLATIQEKMRDLQALEEKVDNAIPISESIMDLSKPDYITNSALFQVVDKPEIDYKPYYLVDYECLSQHRVGGSIVNLESKGIIAIDAVAQEVVDATVERGVRPLVPSGNIAECSSLDTTSIARADLTEKFALTIEEPKMTSVEARKFAKKEIVRYIQTEHKYYVSKKLFAPPRIRTLRPFKKDIEILDSRMVYVPYAAFKLRVKDKIYQRTSQAATKKMLLDETYRCCACENRAKVICERCGNLACFRHCKRCVSCNKIICDDCTTTQGVFRRKDYCHECVPE